MSAIDVIALTWTAAEVIDHLRHRYGRPVRFGQQSPVDELVSTILSQHTSDANTERAFGSLKRRYRTWEQVIDAPTAEVAATIRSGGLAQQKAPRIQQVLRDVRDRSGGFDLAFLGELPVHDARDWLTQLGGVGPKTASCVLLFALDQPAMPVDTHVHRVALRLGLLPTRTSAERAHEQLESQIAPEDRYDAHLLFIKHGRGTCVARKPRCATCVLRERCPTGRTLLLESLGSASRPALRNGTA